MHFYLKILEIPYCSHLLEVLCQAFLEKLKKFYLLVILFKIKLCFWCDFSERLIIYVIYWWRWNHLCVQIGVSLYIKLSQVVLRVPVNLARNIWLHGLKDSKRFANLFALMPLKEVPWSGSIHNYIGISNLYAIKIENIIILRF